MVWDSGLDPGASLLIDRCLRYSAASGVQQAYLSHVASSVGGSLSKTLIWLAGMYCPQGRGTERDHPPTPLAAGGAIQSLKSSLRGDSFGVVPPLQILKSDLDQEKAPSFLGKLLFHGPWV